jgi:hypothetical protein
MELVLTSTQVLISFFFSATAVFLVVLYGYFTKSLPSDLYQPADYCILNTRETFRGHQRPTGSLVGVQSQRQQRRSQVIVAFLKTLTDQQLITGLTILIATVATRCQTTVFELRIVTVLAYFTATSHALSLGVLRGYLYQHTWARGCRVFFALVFLIMFVFMYAVDHSISQDVHDAVFVQCLFVGYRPNIFTGDFGSITVSVLVIVVGKHVSGLSQPFITPTSFGGKERHVLERATDRYLAHSLHIQHKLPMAKCNRVVYDASIKYDERRKDSADLYYFVESYHNAYFSQIPIWLFQFAYGTSSIIRALWLSRLPLSKDFAMLSFGQVVALGLLVLSLLALVQMINGMSIWLRLFLR